ncbi:MAG: DsbA family protein [Inquilinus sp.]|nr:DsbA family protein [Inquilinus sp.]
MNQQLIYFADPMCSWCWGFSPAIETVAARFGERLPVRLILGGLRPGTTEIMDDAARRMIRGHWEHVREASGQPFDFAFFEREGFVYDTEPACRAVVAARRLDPARAMPLLKRLHHAFYAENADVTDRDVLCGLAESIGLDRAAFAEAYDSGETLTETRTDFAIAYNAGITGFPTLIVGSEAEGFAAVSRGYQPGERIEALIEGWLAQREEAGTPA